MHLDLNTLKWPMKLTNQKKQLLLWCLIDGKSIALIFIIRLLFLNLGLDGQLVDKDPDAAIVLFWKAINAGDRVDSALKDMAVVMKQQDRAEEAIEAIRSFRDRCSKQAQESLDNVLIDLYKVCKLL